jgi:hypothetical protein
MIRTILRLSLLLWPIGIQAQQQASCSFTFLPTTVNIPNVGPTAWTPSGINDYGTVVGLAVTNLAEWGVIRWAGGGITAVWEKALVARNDNGITIGYSYFDNNQPFVMTGTTIDLLSPFGQYVTFVVAGLNNWGTIVATYQQIGYKIWSNGSVVTLKYPGAYETAPFAINDSGMIVGFYEVSGHGPSGFIYSNGQWAALNYPKSTNTLLVGISNAGRIIGGTADANGFTTSFIYENGGFKTISAPNAIAGSTRLLSMSLRSGLILGTANFSTGTKAFVARCQ